MRTPAIHYTDLHLDKYTTGSKTPGDRLEDGLRVIDDVFEHAIKIGAKFITFGGDWNNTAKFIATEVENKAMARLAYWRKKAPDIVQLVISGNHDFATKNLLDSPAQTSIMPLAVAFPENFKIIDNKYKQTSDNSIVYGIPYYEYPEHYSIALDEAVKIVTFMRSKNSKLKVTLLIHQTPDVIGNATLKADTEVRDLRYLNFDMVWCGHIHIVQAITPKFVLAGNPYHKDLSDAGLEKGFWVYDLANPTDYEFVSRRGKYPEFRKVKEGTVIPEDSRDIITVIPESKAVLLDERADTTTFGAGVTHEEIMINYCQSMGEVDEERLQVGLNLLK